MAASLHHPNVVAVYDWGEDDTPFMVLELLEGGSLRSILDRGDRLSPAQAATVGRQIAAGLEYAHVRGLVHRDVKPANLLFDEHGTARVADFGLARALAEASWTEPAGAVLGTARYAAPEQVRGLVDARSDVYSLALVLVEAVTGAVPFAADTSLATLLARVERHLEVSPDLGALAPCWSEPAGPTPPTATRTPGPSVPRWPTPPPRCRPPTRSRSPVPGRSTSIRTRPRSIPSRNLRPRVHSGRCRRSLASPVPARPVEFPDEPLVAIPVLSRPTAADRRRSKAPAPRPRRRRRSAWCRSSSWRCCSSQPARPPSPLRRPPAPESGFPTSWGSARGRPRRRPGREGEAPHPHRPVRRSRRHGRAAGARPPGTLLGAHHSVTLLLSAGPPPVGLPERHRPDGGRSPGGARIRRFRRHD